MAKKLLLVLPKNIQSFVKVLYSLVTATILLVSTAVSGQQKLALKDSLFSEAIASHFKDYKKKTNEAFSNHNHERGKFLFDSLVNSCLRSKFLDDFKVKRLNGKTISLNSHFKKPVFLITYASWCVTSKGETPALNAMAEKYHDKIDFVVLFWDDKNTARKIAKQYHRDINVVYIDEKDNLFSREVINLKHTFGFPTSFYIDSENRVMDIKRVNNAVGWSDSYLSAYTAHYNFFVDGLSSLLINGEIIKEHLAGK